MTAVLSIVVRWEFDKAGSTANGVTIPHDTYFAFVDDELVGYVVRDSLTIVECTHWRLYWYCGAGEDREIASSGIDLGLELTWDEVRDKWLEVFAAAVVMEAEL